MVAQTMLPRHIVTRTPLLCSHIILSYNHRNDDANRCYLLLSAEYQNNMSVFFSSCYDMCRLRWFLHLASWGSIEPYGECRARVNDTSSCLTHTYVTETHEKSVRGIVGKERGEGIRCEVGGVAIGGCANLHAFCSRYDKRCERKVVSVKARRVRVAGWLTHTAFCQREWDDDIHDDEGRRNVGSKREMRFI